MTELGLEPSTYEGPTGIVGVLADTLSRAGMQVLMLWSAIPHYVSHPPCPKATLALLSQLEKLLDVSLDLGELPELARAWERGVDELAAEDSEVAEYVTSLEQQQDAAELPEASGEAIAAEFERYLRRRSARSGRSLALRRTFPGRSGQRVRRRPGCVRCLTVAGKRAAGRARSARTADGAHGGCSGAVAGRLRARGAR